MQIFKKLFLTSLVIAASVFSVSICAFGAQIDSLSIIGNRLYADVTTEDSRLYFASYNNEGLLSAVFFDSVNENGRIEFTVSNEATKYKLFFWNKESLVPVSVAYNFTNGKAYPDGSSVSVPGYLHFYPKVAAPSSSDSASYLFDQEDDVMIVSSVSNEVITGFKAGVEVSYPLVDSVAVMGLSDDFSKVVPGSVVLIGTNDAGYCAAIELLASIGIPVNPAVFEENFGIYNAADRSSKYINILAKMYSKTGTKLTARFSDSVKISYQFASSQVQCYSVVITTSGEAPVITYESSAISAPSSSSVFKNTSEYNHYLYLRYNSESNRVTQCVLYCLPTNFDPTKGDDEYTGAYSLDSIDIIE